MLNSMKRNGLVLALFGMAATAVVAVTHQLTEERIYDQQQKQLLKTLHQILPADEYDIPLHQSCHLVSNEQYLGTEAPQRAFIALKEGRPVGLALETTAPDGYNGEIHLIVGVNWNEELLGVRTLDHKETPGLGDGIDLRKSDWVQGFVGYRLIDEKDKRISVKKDGGEFDQFTGATITPRAYTKAVRHTLNYIRRFKEEIPSAPSCGEKR
ncbi:electron transport complex subunit RsxG [Ferrimonas sediminicola]|uniref:Ion-translocating oxidoreductase complex subunit G n=1 Tax=Ferrimonas sediminicola TaxID=2569538 RepID=A0A4U1BC32_9GAMM|nr:electron transport complex subunit RsxG [Ferrimonas sediminicola]TKB48558.1 electron transport complex subunit RsxG [Ferrimonas sediminicola]